MDGSGCNSDGGEGKQENIIPRRRLDIKEMIYTQFRYAHVFNAQLRSWLQRDRRVVHLYALGPWNMLQLVH